jgi:hypothetical protein
MKKKLRAVGAAGLAAATIVTGLSFGPAAQAAKPLGNVEVTGKWVTKNSSSSYFTITSVAAKGETLKATEYRTANAAAAASDIEWMFPSLGSEGSVRPRGSSLCVTDESGVRLLVMEECSGALNQKFAWTKQVDERYTGPGYVLRTVGRDASIGGGILSGFTAYSYSNGIPSVATDTFPFVDNYQPNFSAEASQVDVIGGTATVSGWAPTDATSVRVQWTDEAGNQRQKTASVADGKYSAYLEGLKIGTTTVELTAREGSEPIATTTVDVKLEVAPVTATATFADDVHTVVQVSGTAQPNAKVMLRYAEDDLVTVKADAEGKWSTPLNAPNEWGNYEISVGQEIRGEDNGRVALDIDYGAGVVVTSPANDFVLEPNEPLEIEGTAPAGTEVNVYDKDTNDVLASTRAAKNNTWFASIDGLEDREYTLVAAGITKGNNRTHSDLKINPGKSSVANPTASVEFPDDVTKKAVVKGTGAEGATIAVKDENGKRLGSTTVQNGAWSLEIDPLGAGKHTLTIEQSGIEDTQTVTTEADFGAAVSLDAPTTFTGGKMTVTGKSSKGAQVVITTGGKQVDSFTVTNADGSFSRDLSGLGSGKIELQAIAKSKGALTTDTKATSTAPITAEAIQISSHVKNGTFTPGEQLFTGRGTVGATVTLNVHGFSPATAAQDLTTTVDQFGEWSIKRGLANTTYPLFSVKQTPQAGVTNELLNWNLRPYDGIGAPGDLQLTNFKDGDFFNPGDQTFAGKATPGATIVFNPFGLDNPAVEQYNITTKADPKTGDWTIRRAFANTNYDRIGVRQEPAAEGKVNQINGIGIAPYGWVGTPADLTVTSHADGTFTPGNQTFTGTATPGTKVTLYAWGDNPANPATAVADARGKWTINRILNTPPATYNIKIIQEDAGTKASTVYLPLTLKQ